VDIDSTVRQNSRFSIDPANSGVRRNNSFQTLPRDSSRHILRISLLHCDLAVAAGIRSLLKVPAPRTVFQLLRM